MPLWNFRKIHSLGALELEEVEVIESSDGETELYYLLAGSSCVGESFWGSRAYWMVSPMSSLMECSGEEEEDNDIRRTAPAAILLCHFVDCVATICGQQ